MIGEYVLEAEKLGNYFARLEASEGSNWSRPLLLCRLWHSLLLFDGEVSRPEFEGLLKSLTRNDDLGSGFVELMYWVGRWAREERASASDLTLGG